MLNINSNTNLVGGYINKDTGGAISETKFNGMGPNPNAPTQYVYTVASNVNHNGGGSFNGQTPPASGTHEGGPAPSGTVDDTADTITMNPLASVTWNLQGNVLATSPVPVPGAVWLMGTALFGLQRLRRKAVVTVA